MPGILRNCKLPLHPKKYSGRPRGNATQAATDTQWVRDLAHITTSHSTYSCQLQQTSTNTNNLMPEAKPKLNFSRWLFRLEIAVHHFHATDLHEFVTQTAYFKSLFQHELLINTVFFFLGCNPPLLLMKIDYAQLNMNSRKDMKKGHQQRKPENLRNEKTDLHEHIKEHN